MIYILCLALVFLSGMTGLIYQVTWQSYLATFLGSHAQATSLVLGTFFLFMALGYYYIGRWAPRLSRNNLVLYGAIEGLIGFYGFSSPHVFRWLSDVFQLQLQNPGLELGYHFLLAAGFIGLPTFLMGGTIPLLTQGLVKNFHSSHRLHSAVYSINTAGAFLGTLIAGFFLIEAFGLKMTIFYTSALNLLIFLAALILALIKPSKFYGPKLQPPTKLNESSDHSLEKYALYSLSFLSGFYVFSIENLVIRIAGISLGSYTYTYTIVVASFIFAIALGSSMVSFFKRITGYKTLIFLQSLIAISTLSLYLSIPHWPYWLNRARTLIHPAVINLPFYWGLVLGLFLLILLVPVGLMGMNLPLLFHFLKNESRTLSRSVGQVYSVNSIGSFLGATVGGYYLFHFLSGDTVFRVSLFLILISFLPLIYLLSRKQHLSLWAGAPVVLGVLILNVVPNWPQEAFTPGLYNHRHFQPQQSSYRDFVNKIRNKYQSILFSEFGPNSLVSVAQDQNGDLALFVNGKVDAHTKSDHRVRSLNALLPLTVAPKTKNVFVIGLGTSLSTGLITQFSEVEHVKVAELSEGVIQALPYFSDYNHNLKERQHKFEIVNEDAFKVLKSEKQKYDIIISEPSNPWVSGVEKLFTRDFLEQGAQRLSDEGIYTQWFPLFGMDEATFLSVLKTFQSVFPWTTVWSTSPMAMMLIGSKQELRLNEAQIQQRYSQFSETFRRFGFNTPLSILGRQALAPLTVKSLVRYDGPIHSLENPILAYRAGRAQLTHSRVNLHQVIERRMDQPLAAKASGSQFLYDMAQGLPKAFFRDNFALMARNKQNRIKPSLFMEKRLKLLYHLRHPQAKQKLRKNQKLLKHYHYLISNDSSYRSQLHWERDMDDLIQRYGDLRTMQLHPKIEALASLMPQHCKNAKCLVTKEKLMLLKKGEAVHGRRSRKPTRHTTPEKTKQRAQIERLFAQSFLR